MKKILKHSFKFLALLFALLFAVIIAPVLGAYIGRIGDTEVFDEAGYEYEYVLEISPTPSPALPASTPRPEKTATEDIPPKQIPTPMPEPEYKPIEAWPVRLRIPSLSVDEPIEDTGIDASGAMEIVPSPYIISWLRECAIPGNIGNSFIAGHNRWRGEQGSLYYLDLLEVGDTMEIDYDDGTTLIFKCESVYSYTLATAPAHMIMREDGPARVTVITCMEPFNPVTGTSDYRIVAIFKEESVFNYPDRPIKPFPSLSPEQMYGY